MYTLSQYLKTVDCQDYLQVFVENDITPDLLPQLDKSALKEMGIEKVGDRLRILILVQLLNMEKLKSLIPLNDMVSTAAIGSSSFHKVEKNVWQKQQQVLTPAATPATGKPSANVVTIISQDGRSHQLDISGCFNSTAIKTKALKTLGISKPKVEEWSAYYMDNKIGQPHLMFDVELTTVCHSVDREERGRIMLCPLDDQLSYEAIQMSNKLSHIKGGNEHIMKNIMGQRPPSQLISSNLGEYFPETGASQLKVAMRNSVRVSMYGNKILQQQLQQGGNIRDTIYNARNSVYSNISAFSRPLSMVSSVFSMGVGIPAAPNQTPTIGDIMLNNTSAVDTIREESDEIDMGNTLSNPPQNQTPQQQEAQADDDETKTIHSGSTGKVSIPRRNSKRPTSIIELLEDGEDEDDFFDSSEELISNLSQESREGPSVWHKGSKIGQGSFGTVYLGLDGITGALMAVKQVDLPKSSTENSKISMIDALKLEMSLLKELNHENIVRYLGSSSDAQRLYIFLEYIPGGSVSSMLNTYGPFEEPLVRNFITQVLIGLRYLHGEGIIHRDIKGANILIDINGIVKISDFGISKKIPADVKDDSSPNTPKSLTEEQAATSTKKKRASLQGSVYWMAPEVVKQIAYTDRADIWSVGCLIVEMYSGKHPYPGFSQMQAIFRIGTLTLPDIPNNATDTAKEFLALTFETDYTKRSSAVQLLKHPFITPLIGRSASVRRG
ncbi:unnamed protein product [Ambrosiozyma monospora]|uniref:mitogen-activated protein kinase kinase kinase n=1 Tax=Ambrosiozyma monospora TaxID=43982 RepID=A0A9W7DFM6_AMBMO|nr:unnamed protein product [Ambrosiozyma monospora]